MSSGAIQIGQSAISTQAKNTIQEDIDAIIEIITNAADELFSKKFYHFITDQGVEKHPAIPSIDQFKKWKDYLGDEKIGEIEIAFRHDYTEISDNGGGIPCSYIESRIKKFGRDVEDQIDMSNVRDFHRRGQFSRGLKEVLAWLDSNDDSGDSGIILNTVFLNEDGEKRSWKGKYIVKPDENEPYYFHVMEKCHPAEEDAKTGTSVRLKYPGDFRIHSSSMLKKLRRHYKLQRIYEEHEVYFKYKSGGRDLIEPYLTNYELETLHKNTKSLDISEDDGPIYQALTDWNEIDYQLHIYRVNLEGNSQLRPQYPQSASGINVRGVYVGDHTTIYGRMLPGDNVMGTERLQAKIIFPALRVFSVLGSSIQDYGLPAFTPSDRKDPNFQHPIFQLIYDDIEAKWLEIVQQEAERMEEEMQRIEDEKTKLMERSVVRKLNDILNSEFEDKDNDDDEDFPDKADESTSVSSSQTRDKTVFGLQRMAYGSMLNLYVGRRRRVICYIHDNLINTESNGELLIETSRPLLIDEDKNIRTEALRIPYTHHDQVASLKRFSFVFQPSLDTEVPMSVVLRCKLDIDTIPEDMRKIVKKNPQNLGEKFDNHYIPENIRVKNGYLEFYGRLQIKENAENTAGLDYINQIVFETDEVIEQNNREFHQSELDRGWDITPIPNPTNPDQINYLFRVYCRSPFFCNTFDPEEILPNQPKDFTTLLSTALSSAVAQAVIENSDVPKEMDMDIHSEKINDYIPIIRRILSNPDLMEQML